MDGGNWIRTGGGMSDNFQAYLDQDLPEVDQFDFKNCLTKWAESAMEFESEFTDQDLIY